MSNSSQPIAIIGASITGLTLALSLHHHSIPSIIYEMRPESDLTQAPLMLAPNALRVLDKLDVYGRVRKLGYTIERATLSETVPPDGVNDDVKIKKTDAWLIGNQKMYGYKALRIMRERVLKVLRTKCAESSIPIHYSKTFSHVVSESPTSVSFALTDDTIVTAPLLVGADGIWSCIRSYVIPDKTKSDPIWSGALAITATISAKEFDLPDPKQPGNEAWELPFLISSSVGVGLFVPYTADGSEIQLGRQWPSEDRSRAGWKELANDGEFLHQRLKSDIEVWPEPIRNILTALDKDTVGIWPYYSLQKLERWRSETGRVIILGDAAHAIPPMAGQGACQAIEGAWGLSKVLANHGFSTTMQNGVSDLKSEVGLEAALAAWEEQRQEHIAKVVQLTKDMNSLRLPLHKRDELGHGEEWWANTLGTNGELAWVYGTGGVETL